MLEERHRLALKLRDDLKEQSKLAAEAAQAEAGRRRVLRDEGYSAKFAKSAVAKQIRETEMARIEREKAEAEAAAKRREVRVLMQRRHGCVSICPKIQF